MYSPVAEYGFPAPIKVNENSVALAEATRQLRGASKLLLGANLFIDGIKPFIPTDDVIVGRASIVATAALCDAAHDVLVDSGIFPRDILFEVFAAGTHFYRLFEWLGIQIPVSAAYLS